MSALRTVLITGASSALMTELIEKIDRQQYKIIAVTRDKSRIKTKEIEIAEGDIADEKFIEQVIRDNKIDLIIHAAAVTHTFHAKDYFFTNLLCTMHLVNVAKKYKVSKFVFISSRTAGEQSGAYGESKLKAEEYIKEHLTDYLIIRPSEVFGGNKGEGIDKLIEDVFNKKILICPVNLKSKMYPIYNKDAINIIYGLIFNPADDAKMAIVNGKEGYTYYELIKEISKAINKSVLIIPIPKFVLYTFKWLIEMFRIKSGFVPDQIPRLYSPKEIGRLNYYTMSIKNYVIAEKNKQSARTK
jgi:dTDP-4-dehydrorhamnose reductase